MDLQKINLLYSALISYEWIFYCKSEKYTLKEELRIYEDKKGGPIINAGLLISFGYMVFVFATESKLYNDFILKSININDFEIEKGSHYSSGSIDEFIRRIRNSFAHSRVSLSGKYLILEDTRNKKTIDFRVKILAPKFGDFMNKILKNWNDFMKNVDMNGNKNL